MSSRIVAVIVTCPQCAARYRLSEEVLARRARLRCAACQHRWVPELAEVPPEPISAPVVARLAEPPPEPVVAPPRAPRGPITEADEEAAFLAVQEQIRARWQDAATPVTPARDPEDADDAADDLPAEEIDSGPVREPPSPESPVLRTAIAIIAGVALSIAAAGLWIGNRDLTGLPLVGPALARFDPPSPVSITVTGTTTMLPSGKRLLEVNGTIANPGRAGAPVPPLQATLSGPDGVALRWAIPTPHAVLPPGQQIGFSSTVTGFPETARTLTVAQAR
jgi:predicted Zn finger-like uncharacterized protein